MNSIYVFLFGMSAGIMFMTFVAMWIIRNRPTEYERGYEDGYTFKERWTGDDLHE